MKNNNLLQRFLFESHSIRGEWVKLTDSYLKIVKQHQYPPQIKHLIGQMLVISVLLTATLKFKGNLTVQFQGKKGLKLLLAQCDDQFHIRGLAQWDDTLVLDQVGDLLKQGLMVITIDPESGSRYQGMVEWEGNSLAQSIEGYFRRSEQLPTRLWLAVNDEMAAGFLLQAMPASSSMPPQEIENSWQHTVTLADTLTEKELLTLEAQKILHRLYSEEDLRLFEPVDIIFQCRCSLSRCEDAIKIAGKQEIYAELKSKKTIEVKCEFCSKTYLFDKNDIDQIFSDESNIPPTIH